MAHDARWLRRSRARQRAEARRTEQDERLAEFDARYSQAAALAALHAAIHGRGGKARRHTA